MSPSDEAGELLDELRRLAKRFPLPHPIWHRFVPEMHEVVRDLFTALDAIATLPRAQLELVLQVEANAEHANENAGGPALAAAQARLRDLPIPQGEHPYLDEILITLQAAKAALAALAAADGEAAFAHRLPSPGTRDG
jgi:hypothetical protein